MKEVRASRRRALVTAAEKTKCRARRSGGGEVTLVLLSQGDR